MESDLERIRKRKEKYMRLSPELQAIYKKIYIEEVEKPLAELERTIGNSEIPKELSVYNFEPGKSFYPNVYRQLDSLVKLKKIRLDGDFEIDEKEGTLKVKLPVRNKERKTRRKKQKLDQIKII